MRQNWPLINFLMQKLPTAQVKAVLSTLTTEQVNTLGEIAVNILYGTIPITNVDKRLLKRYASKIEYIGDARNCLKKRKSLIQASPKIIGLLLNAAKPLMKSLL